MRSTLLYILAATVLPSFSVLAQRHGGGGGFRFDPNGPDAAAPSTLVTVTSAAPVAATAPVSGAPPTTSAAAAAGTSSSGGVDPSLIPPFNITAGIHLNDGTGNCQGDGGKGIPCDCPPKADVFQSALEKFVAAGRAFPSGTTPANQLARLQTCIVTLQNFKGGAGSGVGCPAVSTTWKENQAFLQSQIK